MRYPVVATALAVGLVCVAASAVAQKPPFKGAGATAQAPRPDRFRSSLSVTVLRTTYHDPFLREPGPQGGSSQELQTGQTVQTVGGRVGWLATFGRFGLEAGMSYLRVGLSDFHYFNPPSQPDSVAYSNVAVGLLQADILLMAKPSTSVPLYVYGILGMGQWRRSYTLTGNVFPEWDGPRTANEFEYTYGLGLRLSPIRQFSLVAEYRWVPGDLTSSIPAGGCYIYYSRQGGRGLSASVTGARGASSTPDCPPATYKSGSLLSLGVAVAVP
jgi:opacity protein-like surface antigen